MPRPVADEVRAQIVALFGPDARRNQIARDCGVSGALVTKIAQEEGFEFDRSLTDLAVRAAQLDAKALRTSIAAKFLARADESLEKMSDPHEYFNWDRDGKFDRQVLDAPTPADQRQYMTIAAIAVQRHADLVKMDLTPETQQSESVVEKLFGSIVDAVDAHRKSREGMAPVDGAAEGMSE